MNIEKLSKEIDSEKEKMAPSIELYETEMLTTFYYDDILFLSPFALASGGVTLYIVNNPGSDLFPLSNPLFWFIYILFTALPLLPMFLGSFSVFKKRNLSFYFRFLSFFKKQKLKKSVFIEKKKVASTKTIDNNFLKKIALNMDKSEFKDFLKECNGNITLKKLESFIYPNDEKRKRTDNIEELTTIIYKENELTHNFLKGENNEYKRNI